MKTFKKFLENKKKLKLALNIEGEPVVVEKKKKHKKKKLKLALNIEGEPVAVEENKKKTTRIL